MNFFLVSKKSKKFPNFFFEKVAFYGLDMELEPESEPEPEPEPEPESEPEPETEPETEPEPQLFD